MGPIKLSLLNMTDTKNNVNTKWINRWFTSTMIMTMATSAAMLGSLGNIKTG
jgi:hypothetical protein